MDYDNNSLKEILDDIILNMYGKNPVVLKNIWDGEGEKKYIGFLHSQYEKILLDFNKIFDSRFDGKRVLEISSFLVCHRYRFCKNRL